MGIVSGVVQAGMEWGGSLVKNIVHAVQFRKDLGVKSVSGIEYRVRNKQAETQASIAHS